MYKVFINNFMRNGSLVSTEEIMFSVPSINSFPVQKPVVKASEDAAENFSFTMDSNSQYYDALLQHKTLIRVVYDGPNETDTDIIFDGKVLSISTSTVYHTKNVTCAGYYVFFNDSYYEGKQEKHRAKMTVAQYYAGVITNHNTMLPEKAVTQGTTEVTLPTEQDKYEPSAWTQTSGLLSNLTSNYGGHMLVQSSGNTRTLIWYKYYARDLGDGLRPKVTVGKNILDISADYSGDNIFTRVIPIGATNSNGMTIYIDGYKYDESNTYSGKAMPVTFIRNLYTDQELTDEFHSYTDYRDAETNFGVIYKTVTFSDADTQAKLWNYCKKWIKDSYFGIATSFTVKAIDLHITDGNYPKILIGECVDVTYLIVRNGTAVWETKKLVCKSVSYDLFNPENNSYTFSVPSDLLDHSRTSKKSSKNQTASASGSSKTIPKGDEDEEITWHKVWKMIGTLNEDADYEGTSAALSFYNNGELSGTVYCVDPDEITTGSAGELNEKKFAARLIGKITLSGKSIKWVAVSSDRGIFAYTENRYVKHVSHWYDKHKGYKYTDSSAEESLSSFETIAQLIEKDTDANWGGTTAATSFRSNGKISGSINKAYDPQKCTPEQAAADASLVFSADIVGKFTLSGTTKYVAVSKEHGIFGYNASARGIIPATHWYSQYNGANYDNINNVTSEEQGSTYITADGNIEGDKTLLFENKPLNYPNYDSTKKYALGALVANPTDGKVYKCTWIDPNTGHCGPEAWNSAHWTETSASVGQVFIGHDTTGASTWKIKLNEPIAYEDADGNLQVVDGSVGAEDFNIPSIPSFKTKIGIFDIVVANKVSAEIISADLAEVRKWLGEEISADTYIRSHLGYFDILSAEKINANTTGGVYSNHLYYTETGMSPVDMTTHIYQAMRFTTKEGSENAGKIFLQGIPYGSMTYEDIANFKMADTQWYKDQLDSARAAVHIGVGYIAQDPGVNPSLLLGPGEWGVIQGSFTNQNGTTSYTDEYKYAKGQTDGNLLPENIKDGVIIFGVTGEYVGSGSSASDIRGKNGQPRTGEPSGYTFSTLENAIANANASRNGKWVTFEMYIDGNPSDTKTYKVFVNGYGY